MTSRDDNLTWQGERGFMYKNVPHDGLQPFTLPENTISVKVGREEENEPVADATRANCEDGGFADLDALNMEIPTSFAVTDNTVNGYSAEWEESCYGRLTSDGGTSGHSEGQIAYRISSRAEKFGGCIGDMEFYNEEDIAENFEGYIGIGEVAGNNEELMEDSHRIKLSHVDVSVSPAVISTVQYTGDYATPPSPPQLTIVTTNSSNLQTSYLSLPSRNVAMQNMPQVHTYDCVPTPPNVLSPLAAHHEASRSGISGVSQISQSPRWICNRCVQTFGREGDLRRHYKKHFPSQRTFHCDGSCNSNGRKGFYRRDKLVDHQKRKHGL